MPSSRWKSAALNRLVQGAAGPALLIALFAIQAFWHAASTSPTYDESGHLAVSHLLARTDHQDYEIGHPPLVRILFAVPLKILGASLPSQMAPPTVPESVPLTERPSRLLYYYSSFFVSANSVPAGKMILAARGVTVLLSVLCGFWVYRLSRRLYGPRAGILSLFFFAFCPNLIAHGSLITTDMGGVAFAIGFLDRWAAYVEDPSGRNLVLCGLLLGAALASKYTNLFLPPLLVVLLFVQRPDLRFLKKLKVLAAIAGLSWLVLAGCYRFERIFTPHTLQEEDWRSVGFGKTVQAIYRRAPLPDAFLRGLAYGVYHDRRGHAAFFFGEYSNGGWKLYFPAAFLLKTPTLVLLALGGWIALLFAGKLKLGKKELPILGTVFFLCVSAFNAHLNIGLRHILLLYPLLYILFGQGANLPLWSHRAGRWAQAALIFLPLETLSLSPHYLAFFNRISGGPENAIHSLSDSNIDWGQDLKGLSRFLKKEGDPELLLAYFGTALPQSYGIRAQALPPTTWLFPRSEHLNSAEPQRELCAVSVTNLQGTYFKDHGLYRWLLEKEPLAKIGYSLYVYDVTEDLESQKKFLAIYAGSSEPAHVRRQEERIRRMERKAKG